MCAPSIAYPANTPFYVDQGWNGLWHQATAEDKAILMSPATYFEFRVDSVPQRSTMFAPYFPGWDMKFKHFISEYDMGMVGSHVFEGRWFIDGAALGGTPGEPVLHMACTVTATFA